MNKFSLNSSIVEELEHIYIQMEEGYNAVANELNFGCEGCPDNCCDSYFVHHTYLEWSYLWVGILELPEDKRQNIFNKSEEYVKASENDLMENKRPQHMCPLNEGGLCILYKHRLMVCRTHGVPAQIIRPDGKKLAFPGCFRCQEKVGEKQTPLFVNRTPMLQKLAALENRFLENKRHLLPKVKLTIAEMIVKGAPQINTGFCKRK